MDKVAKNIVKSVSRSTSNKNIIFEARGLARFSDGSCTCRLGDSSVLVTAVSEKTPKNQNYNYTPLTVDYRQKAAAFGRIPTTHLRRDIGVTEKEILTARMIDRSIRPSFPFGYRSDTQVICNLLSVDGTNDPDVLAINGASAALSISDIPWAGPIGATRVGLVGELPVVNPTRKELENSRLNLVVAANNLSNVVMLDGSCKEPVLLPDISKAIKSAIKECRTIIESIVSLQSQCGKPKRSVDLSIMPSESFLAETSDTYHDKIKAVLQNHNLDKVERDLELSSVREQYAVSMQEKYPDMIKSTIDIAFGLTVKKVYREIVLQTKIRCDGRKIDEVRQIECQVDLYKPLHGSALFQRGQTQVFCSTTFDSPDAAFRTDLMTNLVSGVKEKNFMLHYEFPPFATNEVGRVGGLPGRRDFGHGALAEKGIRPVVPDQHDMAIRLNCEVLESNGSSSMASVCAGSMSLMDAGVNIKEHVAGVAMGLISDSSLLSNDEAKTTDSNSIVLTDILGFEDFIGDMDFKIAGTKRAITALQLDVKPLTGITMSTVQQALQKAHSARSLIISKMSTAITNPRKEKKDNHPILKTFHIPIHKVPQFLGFGGSNLKKLMANIGVRISSYGGSAMDDSPQGVNPQQDNFVMFAPNKEALKEAEEYIETLLAQRREPEFEFNGIYTATIVEIRDNGLMVTLYPNMKPTLLPLSQLDIRVVKHPSVLNFEVGQTIQVKYFGRDPATGIMRLSRKSLQMTSVARVHQTPLG